MQSSLSNTKLKNYLDSIKIKKGDKILLSSDILRILVNLKKEKNSLDPNTIIDTLIEKIGKEGTLLVPMYNWDFCEGLDFHYRKTKSRVGSLGNICIKRTDFKRSKNPIYSFAVFGKDQKKICELQHKSCFGLDSPFGYLIKNKGKNIFIGIDYKKAFSFAHVAEEAAGVEYRYFKNFKGVYIDSVENKKIETYKMYVRKTDLVKSTLIRDSFDNILIKNNAYIKSFFNKIYFSSVDIYNTHHIMVEDIKKNRHFVYPEWYE